MMKLKKNNQNTELNWDYEPPKINNKKETIDDMSLIVGMYGNYIVSKTGNLIGIMEVSGVNLDLLMIPNKKMCLTTMAHFS